MVAQPIDVHPTLVTHAPDRADDEWTGLLFEGGPLLRARVMGMPYDEWAEDPGMLLALAASYRWDGPKGAYIALPHLDAADRVIASQEEPDFRFSASSALMRGIAERTRGRIDEALRLTERALDTLRSPGVPILDRIDLGAIAVLKRGAARVFTGDLTSARRDLRNGLVADEATLPVPERLEALGFLALVDILSGSLRAAERTLQQAQALSAQSPEGLWTAPVQVASLMLAAERRELSGESEAVYDLLESVEGSEFEPLALHVFVLLCEARGRWEEAMDAVHRLREIEREWQGSELIRLLRTSDAVEVHLRLGSLAQARRTLAEETDRDHVICAHALRARLAVELGDFETAVRYTRECAAVGDDHPVRSQLYALLLDAASHWALGDMRSGDASFRLVLRQAVSMGLRRVFDSLPPRMLQGLVARAKERTDVLPGERALLERLATDAGREAKPAGDLLSPREQVVLARIAAGETPKEIAFSLNVSLNTVKTQVRSVYRKLGVSTRAGAIERARAVGVLGS